ncbi:ADP-ribosylglycohydrolase family protein [Puniceicoccaceae bacterium K14]|nr:ADP-ribosylglycohydrolase family protein [Puniceicoccaceae bacterium K14]
MKNIVITSLAADSLSLGPHWLYDDSEIQKHYPIGISQLDAPRSNYHPGKSEGDLTHYGDQSLALLESLANRQEWSANLWRTDWAAYWGSHPQSYQDGATKATLANLKDGSKEPSDSSDISAVSRMAPLLAYLWDAPLEERVAAARAQVSITHGYTIVADAAEFFTRSLDVIAGGADFETAFESSLKTGNGNTVLSDYFTAVKDAISKDTKKPYDLLGLSCSVHKAFPLTLWFALTFENEPTKMISENAIAGGDNSARAMILGMLIAAQGKYNELPAEWSRELNSKPRIDDALAKLNLSQ